MTTKLIVHARIQCLDNTLMSCRVDYVLMSWSYETINVIKACMAIFLRVLR